MIRITTTLTNVARTQSRITAWKIKLPKAVSQQTRRQALRLTTLIKKGIRSGAPGGKEFEPLADSTIEMKRSSKPLIHHGDLIRSINTDSVGRDAFFVGVNRNAKNKEGDSMVNLAEIHENGTDPYSIPVTAKLRKFWYAMYSGGIFLSPTPGTEIFHPGIPARPFLGPSYDEWSKDVERQFSEGLARALGVGRV